MEQVQPHERPLKVIGRYAVFGKLAAGGMATVHLGRLLGPAGFSRTVAIKRLHPQFAKDPEFVAMFLDEARLAARIQHPNVVATVDVVARDDELFLVMDYVRGESFSRLLRASRKKGIEVPARVIANIVSGMCYGLHAAHEAKDERGLPLSIVHRDVSPQNVIIGADGVPRVLDFGVAKAAARVQVTRDGQMKGKLCYMSPEQLSGAGVDRRSDIFAAGIVLWEALTGRRLFDSEDAKDILNMILKQPVPPPSSVANVPGVFDIICEMALARNPDERFQTAREFAVELEDAVAIASPREVGDWVEKVAGPLLSRREQMVAEIESVSSVSDVSHVSESAPHLVRALDRRSAPPVPVSANADWDDGPTTVLDTEALRRESTQVHVPRPATRPPPPNDAAKLASAADFEGDQTTIYDPDGQPPPLPAEDEDGEESGAKGAPREGSASYSPPAEPTVQIASPDSEAKPKPKGAYRPAMKTLTAQRIAALPHIEHRESERPGEPGPNRRMLAIGLGIALVVFLAMFLAARVRESPEETAVEPARPEPVVEPSSAPVPVEKQAARPTAFDPSELPVAEEDEDTEASESSGSVDEEPERDRPAARRKKQQVSSPPRPKPAPEPPAATAEPAEEDEPEPESSEVELDFTNPYATGAAKAAPAPKEAPAPAPAPKAAPAPQPAPAPKPAAKPGCEQPYRIDDEGIRRIKPECL